MKTIEYWETSEVALYVHCLGFNPEPFLENAVDGETLLSLSVDDLTIELGLDEEEAQKLLTCIERSKAHKSGENVIAESENKISELEEKIDYIKKKLMDKDLKIEGLQKEVADLELVSGGGEVVEEEPPIVEASAPPPPPYQAHPYENPHYEEKPHEQEHHGHQGPGVIGGAAVGAAGGAIKGAVIGAILPGMDAGDGAAAGAAVGALGGAAGGFRNRRFRR